MPLSLDRFLELKNFYLSGEKKVLSWIFLSGLLTFFASPPLFLYIFLLISFSFLADSLYNAKNLRQRVIRLSVFIIGYHLANFYWMLHALTVAVHFYWIIPFGAIFICGVAVIMFLISAGPYLWLSKRYNFPWFHYFGIAGSWLIFELMKEYQPFGGVPWQGIGMIFGGNDYIIQIAHYIGIWGCHVLAIFSSLLLFLGLRTKGGKVLGLFAIITFIGLMFFGYFRVKNASKQKLDNLPIVGIQGNVSAKIMYSNSEEDETVLTYIKQSQVAKELADKEVILIWPEGTIDFYTILDTYNGKVFKNLMNLLPENTKYLIFGSAYYNNITKEMFNRISLIDNNGILSSYDKMKLVPFGEYIPPRNFFPFLTKKITRGMIDLSKGKEYSLLKAGNITFAPIICFESIFASRVIDSEKIKYADMILQITNDVWFGNSIGPYQHLVFSKFLAVIYKKPLIRVANSGVSVIYNEYGELLKSIPLNTAGFVNFYNLSR